MSANIVNQASYLRTSRNFPEDDMHKLSVEINRSYLDIANAVNSRTISIFPTNRPVVNGESWFFNNQRQQAFRQIYPFTAAGNVPHGINFSSVSQFTKCSGSYTTSAGTMWFGAIYSSSVGIAGQVTFYVTATNIVIVQDATAPVIGKGTIVLEWISQV